MNTKRTHGLKSPHQQLAQGWGLTLADLRDHCEFLNANETRQQTGGDTPSIGWVYYDVNRKPTGIVRYRHFDPSKAPSKNGKPRRYSGKSGDPVALYAPPVFSWRSIARDTNETIYITEGEAKAYVAALRYELCVLGIQGCSAWQAKGVPAEQFADFVWKGRRVDLLPDSDWERKADVRRWFCRLGKYLQSLGADVHVRFLDDLAKSIGTDGDPAKRKTGLDDWFRAHSDGTHSKQDNTQVLEKFKQLPTRPLSDPFVQQWDCDDASELPAILRNVKPIDPAWLDEDPPPLEYILSPYLQVGESGLAIGEAGIGKTTFDLEMFVAVGTATQFFGHPVTKHRRVMYVMLERHADKFRRRIHRVAHAMVKKLKLADGQRARFFRDMKANCFPIPLAGEALNLIVFKDNQWVPSPVVDKLITELKAAQIELLFLDPLSRLHGGNENDSSVASAITKALERIVQQAGCSIVLVHHTGKSSDGGQYSGRGSSAFNDNTSETIVLTRLEDSQLKNLDLADVLRDDEQGCDIVLVHHARCSDGRAAEDMYLVRRKDGLLRRLFVKAKSPEQLLNGLMPKINEWVMSLKGVPFTRNDFIKAKQDLALTKTRANEFFDTAASSKVFVPTGGTRRGGKLYRCGTASAEISSLPGNSRATGNHRKTGRKSQKPGGAQSA